MIQMKDSDVNKFKAEVISETMSKFENRPGEYSIMLNPVSRAKLEFSMQALGYSNVEEVIINQAEKLFDLAINKTLYERGQSKANSEPSYTQTSYPDFQDFIRKMFGI